MDNTSHVPGRRFLRSNWELLGNSDQDAGAPCPEKEKPRSTEAPLVTLPPPSPERFRGVDATEALENRRSRRSYSDRSLPIEVLSYLLYATQGIQRSAPTHSRRPVPSAGARHPFETYVAAMDVEGLEAGLYRYLPFSHALCLVRRPTDLRGEAEGALHGQGWNAPVIFFWTAVPYRTEWRYQAASPKLIALDAGHLCQNLYLACEVVGAGTCAIGAYDQDRCDGFLGVDGNEELAVYAAPVGMRK